MRNEADWRPTKFVLREDRLRASSDDDAVAPASRFITNVLAPRYHELLRRHAAGRLLDLGAGAVPLYEAYRPLVDEVTCVDWNQSAHAGDHIDLQADLDQSLPLETASYDTVVLTDVLEHVYQPHALMAEVARILAPRGKLLLTVPFFYWIHEAPHDYARYTSFMLRRLCEDNGLTVLSLAPTGGSPEVMLDLIGKHLAWSKALAALHGRVALWALRLPGVSKLSTYSARWFPQGHMLVAQKP
jgi:SAM-dependent methyltransferase